MFYFTRFHSNSPGLVSLVLPQLFSSGESWRVGMSLISWHRLLLLIVPLGLMSLGCLGAYLAHAQSDSEEPSGVVINVDGIINGVKHRYISRSIEEAQGTGADLLVIELDTPGGLVDSTRDIVAVLLESPVPVAVYVSPQGARAGSAGTFITAAGHVAAMAPGTNIGAATPVSGTGEALEETLASKVENDAAALIRSIAQERGRNEDALERTVREAASFSANEALELDIIDFVVEDLDHLLRQIDGHRVELVGEPEGRVLQTENMQLRRLDKNLLEGFLEFISDPNVSFLLLTIGGLGIVFELFSPGLIVPGVTGVICLLLALLAFGNLPVNWAAAAFILLAVILAVLETQVSGFGVLGVGSIISLVLGGLLLFTQFGDVSPTLPKVGVNRWLLGGTATVLGLGLIYVVSEIYSAKIKGRDSTRTIEPGMAATVTVALNPTGVVRVENETWTAVTEDGNVIESGESVKVIQVNGLILTVSRHTSNSN